MIFKDQHNVSLGPKLFFCGCILATVFASTWLMFADPADSNRWLKPYLISGDFFRRVLIALCLIIYFLRLQFTVWIFQKRKWIWTETIIISIMVPLALYAFAHVGGNNHQSFGVMETAGWLLYITGSYVNTSAEYRRHVWKLKKENKGRLYTDGLFRYSMHINYFGDVVLFTGFAMTTHSLSMLVIPLIMTANFIFNIIPSLDRYLAKKYGVEFRDYSQKTKKLIPWIY
jgi:protein-S-isoprenylcysteine O-methyltransferase Ste14